MQIANPGAVALPTLVPLRFQKANQRADAAVRYDELLKPVSLSHAYLLNKFNTTLFALWSLLASRAAIAGHTLNINAFYWGIVCRAVSARRNSARQAARPVTPPTKATVAPQAAASAGAEQPHRPSSLQLPRDMTAPVSVQPAWDTTVQPMTQLHSPGRFADEEAPAVGQHYSAAMQYSAAQEPDMSLQQPMTQQPWQGGDDSLMTDWPERPPAPLPGLPAQAHEEAMGPQVSAAPWVRPSYSAAQHSVHAAHGKGLLGDHSREQRQWYWQQEAPVSRPFNTDMRPAFERGNGQAANAAPQEWCPGQQRMQFPAVHDQRAHSPSQPLAWASSAAPSAAGQFQQLQQQQQHQPQQHQEFAFASPQAQTGTPQFGPAPDLAFGFPPHAQPQWQSAQSKAGPGREQQQIRSPGPLYAHQSYQQGVTALPAAGSAHAHQQPARLPHSAGYPGWNAGVHQMDGGSVPAQQQQPSWQPQQQLVQGSTAGAANAMGGRPLLPASWDAAPAGMQHQMRQQVFQSGYAPEQLSGVGQQAGGSLQQAAFATALPQGQQYQPGVPFNIWT